MREERKKKLQEMLDADPPADPSIAAAAAADPPIAAAAAAVDCFHLGASWLKLEVVAQGLNPEKNFRKCALGCGEKPGFVCQCIDCGPRCNWYDDGAQVELHLGDK